MGAITQKFKVKIQGKTVPVDKYFLDILAVFWYDEKYEDEEVRKRVNAVVRELVSGEPEISPQIIEQRIALSLLSKKKQAIIKRSRRKNRHVTL